MTGRFVDQGSSQIDAFTQHVTSFTDVVRTAGAPDLFKGISIGFLAIAVIPLAANAQSGYGMRPLFCGPMGVGKQSNGGSEFVRNRASSRGAKSKRVSTGVQIDIAQANQDQQRRSESRWPMNDKRFIKLAFEFTIGHQRDDQFG